MIRGHGSSLAGGFPKETAEHLPWMPTAAVRRGLDQMTFAVPSDPLVLWSHRSTLHFYSTGYPKPSVHLTKTGEQHRPHSSHPGKPRRGQVTWLSHRHTANRWPNQEGDPGVLTPRALLRPLDQAASSLPQNQHLKDFKTIEKGKWTED